MSVGEIAIDGFNTWKSRSLVAYLMMNAERTFGREVLAETVWGEDRAGDTMKALREELWLIRKAFREAGVAPEDDFALEGEDLGARGAPWVDAEKFDAALASPASNGAAQPNGARPIQLPAPPTMPTAPSHHHPLDPAGAARLEAAVAHYVGDLLPGLYDDWCLPPHEILRDKFIIAIERLMHHHAARTDWPTAIIHAKRLLDADPLLEHIHRDLMRFHYARGDRPAALTQFARSKRLLRKELMIEPMAETVALHEAIRGKAAIEITQRIPTETGNLERHRLRSSLAVPTALSALTAVRTDLEIASRRIEQIIQEICKT